MNKISILKNRLSQGDVIIMDGGMGTEILRRGEKTILPLWSARVILDNPKFVKRIHEDYIKAGAEIIITNTFRTTRRTFEKAGIGNRAKEAVLMACKIAKEAAKQVDPEHEVYIAGSIAPLEDCYRPDLVPNEQSLKKEHEEYTQNLKEGNVDFLLAETMNTSKEAIFVLNAAKKAGLPYAVSFCCNKEGRILSGENMHEVVKTLRPFDPLFISINCFPPAWVTPIVKKLKKITDIPIGVYAHGDGQPDDDQGWKFTGNITAEKYLRYAKEWIENGAQIIGGCCGTNPEYIKKLSLFYGKRID